MPRLLALIALAFRSHQLYFSHAHDVAHDNLNNTSYCISPGRFDPIAATTNYLRCV